MHKLPSWFPVQSHNLQKIKTQMLFSARWWRKKTDAVIISNVIHVIYQKVHKRQRYKSYAVQGVNEEGRMLAFLGLLHGCHTNSHHHNIRWTSTSTKHKGKIQTPSLSECSWILKMRRRALWVTINVPICWDTHRKNRWRFRNLFQKFNFMGPFWEEMGFMADFWAFSDFLLVAWPFSHQSPWNFGSKTKIEFYDHLIS